MKIVVDLKLPDEEVVYFSQDSCNLVSRAELQGKLVGNSIKVSRSLYTTGMQSRMSKGQLTKFALTNETDENDETKSVKLASRVLSIELSSGQVTNKEDGKISPKR